MDDESIEQRVEAAFKGRTGAEFGLRYLEMVQTNWADLVKTLRRTLLLLALLIVAFFLFDHARSGELVVGPLKTENLGALLTLIPAAISYLLFEFIDLMRVGSYYRQVAAAMVKILYPSVAANKLDSLLWPVTSFAIGLGAGLGLLPARTQRISQFNVMLNFVALSLLIGSVFVFLPYAFLRLYGSDHTNVIAVTASGIFVAFNIFRALFVIYDDSAEEQKKEDQSEGSFVQH
jgi:hypothetical protein